MDSPYDRVVKALKERGSRRSGNNWQCPSHDDRTPSLSVNPSTTGDGLPTVLLNCFAGCQTISEVLPALGLDARQLFVGVLQPTLFKDERFSPVRRAGWLALPPSMARDFGVATTFGSFVRSDGALERVWSRHDIVAIVHDRKARAAFIAATGAKPQRYRDLVRFWKAAGMAHRCSPSRLCLFIRPEALCPFCHQSVESDTRLESETVESDTRFEAEPWSEKHASRDKTVPMPSHSLKRLRGSGPSDPSKEQAKGAIEYDGVKALEYLAEDDARRNGGK